MLASNHVDLNINMRAKKKRKLFKKCKQTNKPQNQVPETIIIPLQNKK